MLGKLLELLTQLKAAGVTVVIVASAATVTVAGTSPEVQQTLQQLTQNVAKLETSDCDTGQPEVVAQRNAADKLLRAAYQTHLKALNDLRGGKDQDHKAVNEIVRTYSTQLRATLTEAVNDVAAETLGRVGQVRKAEEAEGTTEDEDTSDEETSDTDEECTDTSTEETDTDAEENDLDSDAKGRVAVAERTTLEDALQQIVDEAVLDMDELVTKATEEVAAVPAPQHGKPENAGNKPQTNPGKKP